MIIGERLRAARHEQKLSLQQVADKAKISAATLSRIETSKQALDVTLLLSLARILKRRPADFVEDATLEKESIALEIARLDSKARSSVWMELASNARNKRTAKKPAAKQLAADVEELLAQIDFVRAEIEAVKRRLKD